MQKRVGLLVVFLVFLGISLVSVLFFRQTDAATPRAVIEYLVSPIQRTFYSAFGGLVVKLSHDQLRETNQILAKRIVEQKELEKEAKALRDQYDLQVVPSRVLLPARVIGMKSFLPGGISIPEEIILDKGGNQGVRRDQTVILTNNVIGKIIDVTNNRSRVALLTNDSQIVTGSTVQTDALGIVRGDGNGGMKLENVKLSDTINEGDIVVTRGEETLEGTGFPPNLVIGKITSVDKKASDLFQTAEIKSLIDFSTLHTVFIIKGNL